MIEVFPRLFVGGADALLHADSGIGMVSPGWFVVSAARDPWHREALGYTGRGAPKDDPEYLLAHRDRRLLCNLIDADDPAFVREEIVTGVIEAIDTALSAGNIKVLIHCNQGQSRAPTLALLWARWTSKAPLVSAAFRLLTADQALEAMKHAYPPFKPSKGMEGYVRNNWGEGE